jgi:hypothetical protein
MKALAKALEDSSRAAACVGPKIQTAERSMFDIESVEDRNDVAGEIPHRDGPLDPG